MNLHGRQRRQIREKAVVVVRYVVAEITAGTDDPAVVFLREHDAVAPVRRTTRDDDTVLAAEIGRPAPIRAGPVADADLDLLIRGRGVTEFFEPRGAA